MRNYQYETIGIINSLRKRRIINPFLNFSENTDKNQKISNDTGENENENEMQIEHSISLSNLANKEETIMKTILHANKLKKEYLDYHLINKNI